jgi:hypothetical protein
MKVKFSSRPFPGVITAPSPCSVFEEERIASIKVESLKKGGN